MGHAQTAIHWLRFFHSRSYVDYLLVGFRICGTILVVPLVEELFWRSFVLRNWIWSRVNTRHAWNHVTVHLFYDGGTVQNRTRSLAGRHDGTSGVQALTHTTPEPLDLYRCSCYHKRGLENACTCDEGMGVVIAASLNSLSVCSAKFQRSTHVNPNLV